MSVLSGEQVAVVTAVALGEAPAETVIRGARVVDVFGQRVTPPTSVALCLGRIASLGPEEPGWLGPETKVVEAEGLYLIPGLIDAHTHLDSIFQLGAYAPHALASGNTCAVSELAMVAGAWGADGIAALMTEAASLEMRLFFLAPPLVPPFPDLETSAGLSFDQFSRILARPDCLGVGETYWPAIIDGEARAGRNYAAALGMGKRLEGHAAGARGKRLMAYAAAGTTSCHESTTAEEALERLSLGLAVQVREGFVRGEMAAVVPALKDLPDTSSVMLVTDLADPRVLMAEGAMNPLLAKAVALGVPAPRAVAWCSLNPARYFGLGRLGAVAPGYLADLVLVRDLVDFSAQAVFLEGRLVAQGGSLIDQAPLVAYPLEAGEAITRTLPPPGSLMIYAPGDKARVRVIHAVDGTITRAAEAELPVEEGQVRADPAQDVLHLAHLSRRDDDAPPALGFVRGWGLQKGALATSMQWDNSNLVVLGAGEPDMRLALARLLELKGGVVVAAEGRILAELPLPFGGIVCPGPLEQVVERMDQVGDALRDLGCRLASPLLALQTLCFTGLPFLRLTDRGLVDVRRRQFVDTLL